MFGNLTGSHVLLIILIILLIWFLIQWYRKRFSKTTGEFVYPPVPTSPVLHLPPHVKTQPMQPSIAYSPTIHMSDSTRNTPYTLYYFFNPSCGYCRQFDPVWRHLVNKYKNYQKLKFSAIDATKSENEHLAFYYNVNAYPTIILVTPDKNVEYEGNRTPEDLDNFINHYYSEQNNSPNMKGPICRPY